jgi:hypothetical protein
MELHTRTRADRPLKRRVLGGALAVTFTLVGIGAELGTASPADATVFHHTVYVGDGVYCNYIGSWPYWSCYAP